jgi:peptidoglycan/LPS O-acetylase OafA/YrhL
MKSSNTALAYKFRDNNFDLIRLIAASQVAILHSLHIMGIKASEIGNMLLGFLHIFPGVPIFFFVSGYLITRSYESNSKLNEYASNRILRVYPALILAVCLSFLLIFISGYMAAAGASTGEWLLLFFAKSTFVQFYNPEFMRDYGDGVLNGSLWTITVELQFYIVVPIVYYVFRGGRLNNISLGLLIAVFFALNRIFSYLHPAYGDQLIYKLISVSFIPWFYMFLVGMFFQRNFEHFHKLLSGKFFYFLIPYVVVAYWSTGHNANFGNNLNPFFYVLLVPVIFSLAYSLPGLSKRITGGNDFSYGIYIYHMPVINFMIFLGFTQSLLWSAIALVVTVAIAFGSWFFVEKPCLKLKHHPFNPMSSKSRVNQANS